MDSIISPFQSAFIEGRQILDPILIANEAMEDYKAKKKKAWMMACLSNPNFSIFINGKTRGRITASRGICQGDPLSPFLFLLVSDVLTAITNKLHLSGQYEDFLVGKDLIHLPLLQFADDILLFCKFDDQILLKFKEAIRLFEWCLGQKVNWEKLALSGVNYPRTSYFKLLLILAARQKLYPLYRWKRFNISRGGRQTLCNAVLASHPTYYLSSFSIPQNVAVSLEKITRNFFWEGYSGSKLNHLVKWNLVSLPSKGGGLDLGGLKTHNCALLTKWGWRFAMEDSAYWRKIICSIHSKEPFGWFT
ncbi:Transposon TX1 uncharacterized [Cucumis melo var. makuwa]|uniref:Transposon TX1 uncharacterized n=1 Tax=Cucumis melo var. makuwa TaxID=1194695 RepID=A0A5D3C9F0_CUCMM|nr:Transposon TX1 uncharacterized [Cucumis melo var. makuwa]TYK06969.1 Transposon TX1 uncharacterized [Cucumis melo var. makuwa]